MNATLASPRTSLAALVHNVIRMFQSEDRNAVLIAQLQAARLVPAVFVPGIEHQAAAAIIRSGLPCVTYRRRTLHRRLDEHLFLDADALTAVRVMACWDEHAHRVRMHVAEIGAPGLWDRIVVHFTEWEIAGRPVPATATATARSPTPVGFVLDRLQ